MAKCGSARLEKLLGGTGVRLLHDRRVPGHGQANIDHIAVGPGGVTVIDAKTRRGKIRRDWEGGLFTEHRTILRINGRDQTKLISDVEKQISYIRAAVANLDIPSMVQSQLLGLPLARARSRRVRSSASGATSPGHFPLLDHVVAPSLLRRRLSRRRSGRAMSRRGRKMATCAGSKSAPRVCRSTPVESEAT